MKTSLWLLMAVALLLPVTTVAQTADTTRTTDTTPFAGMDVSWINGQNRQTHFPLVFSDPESGETILTGVAYVDSYINYDFHRPLDNTHTISATIGRSNEFTINLASIGVEASYKNMLGRLWLQTGNMLHIVQEQDGTVSRGRNTGTGNLKFIREAAAGYHFDAWHGINVEMGIFMSYIGLESYITQENWNYQRSMVCEFTPFYFSGARLQMYPAQNYRTELWLLNGWQSYNSWNTSPGIGSSNYYRPTENLQLVANFYAGNDSRASATRFHHDNSIVARYYNNKQSGGISQAAVSMNNHFGFQSGAGAVASTDFMAGTSIANRVWFNHNTMALTVRGDMVTNPRLHLAFTPSPVAPNDFTDAIAGDPSQRLTLWQATTTFDIMPSDYVTFRLEYAYRHSNVPYFAGRGGTTSPDGWTTTPTTDWRPDLRKDEHRMTFAINARI